MKNPWTVQGVTRIALVAFLLGMAQAALSDEPTPRIQVTGEGSSEIAPDMAVLNFTVMREASTARKALSENSAAMRKVLESMSALGIEKRDLQTASFDIQPRYTNPPRQGAGAGEPRKLVGYIVRNALTVRVRDIARVGEVLDTAVTLGVNEGGSIFFTNDDPSAAIRQARVEAMKEASSKAETLAGAAGVKLGRVLDISEQSYNPRPMAMARSEMLMASAPADSVPIASGENTYRVIVNASFAIDQ